MIQAIAKWFVLGLIMMIGSVGLPLGLYHYYKDPDLLMDYYEPVIPVLKTVEEELHREIEVLENHKDSTANEPYMDNPLKHTKPDSAILKD